MLPWARDLTPRREAAALSWTRAFPCPRGYTFLGDHEPDLSSARLLGSSGLSVRHLLWPARDRPSTARPVERNEWPTPPGRGVSSVRRTAGIAAQARGQACIDIPGFPPGPLTQLAHAL